MVALENAQEDVKIDIQSLQSKMHKIVKEFEVMIEENSRFLMSVEHTFNPVLSKVTEFYDNIR